MNTWYWFLATLAVMLIVVIGLGVIDQAYGFIMAKGFGRWAYRVADKAYDLLLVPIARIHSASGHPSLLHTARHYA